MDSNTTTGPLSLLRVAYEAGVPRGVARAAVRKGLLPGNGWGPADVVVLQVAAALDGFPCAPVGGRAQRDMDAVVAARGLLGLPGGPVRFLLVTPTGTRVVTSEEAAQEAVCGFDSAPLLVLPVGRWADRGGLLGADA